LVGVWDTMGAGDGSAMCIADASTTAPKGALCAEAVITSVNNALTFATRTYSIPAADVATKLSESDPNVKVASLRSLNFEGTTVTKPAIAEKAQVSTSGSS